LAGQGYQAATGAPPPSCLPCTHHSTTPSHHTRYVSPPPSHHIHCISPCALRMQHLFLLILFTCSLTHTHTLHAHTRTHTHTRQASFTRPRCCPHTLCQSFSFRGFRLTRAACHPSHTPSRLAPSHAPFSNPLPATTYPWRPRGFGDLNQATGHGWFGSATRHAFRAARLPPLALAFALLTRRAI